LHKAAPNKIIVPMVINGQSGRLYRNKRFSIRRCLRFIGGSIDKNNERGIFIKKENDEIYPFFVFLNDSFLKKRMEGM
jgi:hypothetical protein